MTEIQNDKIIGREVVFAIPLRIMIRTIVPGLLTELSRGAILMAGAVVALEYSAFINPRLRESSIEVLAWGILALAVFYTTQVMIYFYQRSKLSDSYVGLTEEGIRIRGEDSTHFYGWKAFLKWKENARYLWIYLSKSIVLIMPRTVETDGFPLTRCRELLLEKVGQPK